MQLAGSLLNFIRFVLSSPLLMFGGLFFISAFSLAAAYVAEFIFELEPCILCLYQRIPFALAILFSLAGLCFRKNRAVVLSCLALSGVSFLANSLIAFYHTGVEQKWWVSGVEGCAVGVFSRNDSQSLLDQILKTPAVPCDVIPWADPILGLSMANYNVLMCFGLFIVCGVSCVLIRQNKGQF